MHYSLITIESPSKTYTMEADQLCAKIIEELLLRCKRKEDPIFEIDNGEHFLALTSRFLNKSKITIKNI